MFDRVWQFLTDFIGAFQFWWFMEPYEYGIVISGGKLRRKNYLKGPGGFGLLLPIWEKIAVARTDIQTYIMNAQTLTTKDAISVTVKMACVWQLFNVEYFLLKMADDEQAMYTQCYCAVSELVRVSTWNEMLQRGWRQRLRRRVKDRADKYGVRMLEFELIEMVKTEHVVRLFNETPTPPTLFGLN